jgi:two-component sensor histidine kinase
LRVLALTNAVKYAYPDSEGQVEVNAWVAEEDLWLLISDEGQGLRPGRTGDGLGQGLVLIELVADEVWIVDRSLGGTEIRTRFRLARSGGLRLARHRGQSRGFVASATSPASPRFSTTR